MNPLDLTIAWPFQDVEQWRDAALGNSSSPLYARNTPAEVVLAVEQALAKMESTEAAVSFSSGMAAIFATLFCYLKPNAKVVALDCLYGGSFALLKHEFASRGAQVSWVEGGDEAELIRQIKQGCDVVYIESPSNPLLQQVNLSAVVHAAHEAGAIVICDNTVATPHNQNPAKFGVDIVIHSATKFLSGHVDALAGVVCCSESIAQQLRAQRELIGSLLAPQPAYLVLRGLATFELRMARIGQNAWKLAQFFDSHQAISQCFYPGIQQTPKSESLHGHVGLVSIDLGSRERVGYFLAHLEDIAFVSTLGSTQTLVGLPETTSHVECTPAERTALGIPEGLVRISLGIEEYEGLEIAFSRALASI